VLREVRRQYLSGERVDLTVVARELGLSRATIYRWFGSRDALIGTVIARELELLIDRKRRSIRRRGADGLLDTFDGINRALARSHALRRFLDQERTGAMRLLTGSSGVVQRTAVASVAELIAAEADAGNYDPPADPRTLAYAIVRLAEAFLYNDSAVAIRGDHERLRAVEAALLGVSDGSARHAARRSRRARRPGSRSAR
jgi:AcrR family transcriptional regulator